MKEIKLLKFSRTSRTTLPAHKLSPLQLPKCQSAYFGLYLSAWYLLNTIAVVLCIYGNIKLHSQNNEMYLHKRSLVVFYALNYSIILSMISLLFISFAFVNCHKIVQVIACICCLISSWFFLMLLVTKNWMILYKYKWTYYTVQSKWQQLINSNILKQNQTNWYIIHNKKYGNLYYIAKLFSAYCITGCIICATLLSWIILSDWQLLPLIVGSIMANSCLGPTVVFYGMFRYFVYPHICAHVALLLVFVYQIVI